MVHEVKQDGFRLIVQRMVIGCSPDGLLCVGVISDFDDLFVRSHAHGLDSRNEGSNGDFSLQRTDESLRFAYMNNLVLKDILIGEEWMALRQIAFGAKAYAIPRSVRTRPEDLDLISRDDYGQLVLTETGRGLVATVNQLALTGGPPRYWHGPCWYLGSLMAPAETRTPPGQCISSPAA